MCLLLFTSASDSHNFNVNNTILYLLFLLYTYMYAYRTDNVYMNIIILLKNREHYI